jgi:hypothetical protein
MLLNPAEIATAAFFAAGNISEPEYKLENGQQCLDETGLPIIVREPVEAWKHRARTAASLIAGEMAYKSPMKQAISGFMDADKSFECIIESVIKEKSSTRGLVNVRSWPSKENPTGTEQFRTDRTDGDPTHREFARYLKSLTGHRVRIFLTLEEITSGKNVGRKCRVAKAVIDLGIASETDFRRQPH